jgi:hypothetical protein
MSLSLCSLQVATQSVVAAGLGYLIYKGYERFQLEQRKEKSGPRNGYQPGSKEIESGPDNGSQSVKKDVKAGLDNGSDDLPAAGPTTDVLATNPKTDLFTTDAKTEAGV